MPIIRQDLAERNTFDGLETASVEQKSTSWAEGDENLPVNLASRKKVESSQAFYLHLL